MHMHTVKLQKALKRTTDGMVFLFVFKLASIRLTELVVWSTFSALLSPLYLLEVFVCSEKLMCDGYCVHVRTRVGMILPLVIPDIFTTDREHQQ